MMNLKQIDHILITIPTGTTTAAYSWYADLMELSAIPGDHPQGAIWFKAGHLQLHIREEAGHQTASDRHIAFEVVSLEKSKLFLQGKQVEISFSSKIDGRERCFFRDPWGNRFELIEFKTT